MFGTLLGTDGCVCLWSRVGLSRSCLDVLCLDVLCLDVLCLGCDVGARRLWAKPRRREKLDALSEPVRSGLSDARDTLVGIVFLDEGESNGSGVL